MLFARVGLMRSPDSQPEHPGSPVGPEAALARRWTALCHHPLQEDASPLSPRTLMGPYGMDRTMHCFDFYDCANGLGES